MTDVVSILVDRTPALVAAAIGGRASCRFLEFFTAQIRNPNTRLAYARAAMRDGEEFRAYCVIIFVARHRSPP